MKLISTTETILTAYKTIKLADLKISTDALLMVFGKPIYDNDEQKTWCVSIENNGIVDNYIIMFRFDGLCKRHELLNNIRVAYEVSTNCETTEIETLKKFIISSIFKIVESKN